MEKDENYTDGELEMNDASSTTGIDMSTLIDRLREERLMLPEEEDLSEDGPNALRHLRYSMAFTLLGILSIPAFFEFIKQTNTQLLNPDYMPVAITIPFSVVFGIALAIIYRGYQLDQNLSISKKKEGSSHKNNLEIYEDASLTTDLDNETYTAQGRK